MFGILQDALDRNILWLGVNEMGMIRFNKESEEFEHSICLLGYPSPGSNGVFYSGTWNMGLASYDPGTQECNYISLGPSYPEIPDISQLHSSEVLHLSDRFWLAASHGIIEFDNEGNQKRLFYDYENDRINAFFEIARIIYGPVHGVGPIKVMNPRSQHFRFFSLNDFEATTRYYPSWQVYDAKEDRFFAAAFSRNKIYSIQNNRDKQDLNKIIQTNFRIRGLAADNDDQIWVASDFALYILQRGTDRLIEFKNESLKRAGLATLKIRMVDTDHQGNLCIMGETGFIHFNIRTGKTSIAPINPSSTGDLLWDFSTDATGNVWLTTHGSISRFNPYTDTYSEYTSISPGKVNQLRSTVVTSDGTLWTVGNTLEHFKLQGDSLIHLSNPVHLRCSQGYRCHEASRRQERPYLGIWSERATLLRAIHNGTPFVWP